jgi:hypothetical protein
MRYLLSIAVDKEWNILNRWMLISLNYDSWLRQTRHLVV